MAGKFARQVFDEALAKANLHRSQIAGWVLHPGGRDVLLALRKELELSEADVRWSATVLRNYGNLSSASLYFVLQTALADSATPGWWWLSSFGAGFSCHGAFLRVDPA